VKADDGARLFAAFERAENGYALFRTADFIRPTVGFKRCRKTIDNRRRIRSFVIRARPNQNFRVALRTFPLPAATIFSSVCVISAGTLAGKTLCPFAGSETSVRFELAAASVSCA
jgi:hypothetical protein